MYKKICRDTARGRATPAPHITSCPSPPPSVSRPGSLALFPKSVASFPKKRCIFPQKALPLFPKTSAPFFGEGSAARPCRLPAGKLPCRKKKQEVQECNRNIIPEHGPHFGKKLLSLPPTSRPDGAGGSDLVVMDVYVRRLPHSNFATLNPFRKRQQRSVRVGCIILCADSSCTLSGHLCIIPSRCGLAALLILEWGQCEGLNVG